MPSTSGRKKAPTGSARARGAPRSRNSGPAPLPRDADWLDWKEVDIDDGSVLYGEAGAGSPVLFLHGWGLDHKVYKRALSRLVATGARVVAPAMPGFGGTSPLPRSSTNFRGYADWAARFLARVGVDEPCLVIGHSFGGGVGITLAHDHPDRVQALVLVNSVGGSVWTERGTVLRSMAQRPLWDWGIHLPADLFPLRQGRRVLPVIVAEGLPNLLRDPRTFWRAAGVARRADLTDELDTLRRRGLPVVVLWGESDALITRQSFEGMCATLGNPHVVTVPGTHSWLIADPDAFGEVMTNVFEVMGLPDVRGGDGPTPGT